MELTRIKSFHPDQMGPLFLGGNLPGDRDRKRAEMLFAHLKRILRLGPAAIARAMRCPVRVHVGSDCAEPSQACQVGRPATTTRPCVLCVTVASACNVKRKSTAQSSGQQRTA